MFIVIRKDFELIAVPVGRVDSVDGTEAVDYPLHTSVLMCVIYGELRLVNHSTHHDNQLVKYISRNYDRLD